MVTNKKKGIAVIYDPHNLYQFIWYYATYGKKYEWTALCLPNGYKGEYMSKFCEKSGIFENIIRDEQAYLNASIKTKAKEFFKMSFYAITGRQSQYCKKLISKYVNIDQYEIGVVLTDVGIVSGAFIGLGQEMQIVILEDGMGDYAERPKGYIRKHMFNPFDIQGYLVAKMGYANPAHYYPLKTTKYCEKFCSNPEQMLYRAYKSINILYDFSETDMELFDEIVMKTYPELSKIDFSKIEIMIFSNRLSDFGDGIEIYVKKFQEYVNHNYKKILLKRHPRDETKYEFASNIEVQEIDNSIPAEVFLHLLKNKEILFMYTSSILLYIDNKNYDVSYLYFNGLFEKNIEDKTWLKYITKEEMQKYLKRFDMNESRIIEI